MKRSPLLIKFCCYLGHAVPVSYVPDEMLHFSGPQKESKAIVDHLTGSENIQYSIISLFYY